MQKIGTMDDSDHIILMMATQMGTGKTGGRNIILLADAQSGGRT